MVPQANAKQLHHYNLLVEIKSGIILREDSWNLRNFLNILCSVVKKNPAVDTCEAEIDTIYLYASIVPSGAQLECKACSRRPSCRIFPKQLPYKMPKNILSCFSLRKTPLINVAWLFCRSFRRGRCTCSGCSKASLVPFPPSWTWVSRGWWREYMALKIYDTVFETFFATIRFLFSCLWINVRRLMIWRREWRTEQLKWPVLALSDKLLLPWLQCT